MTSIYRRDLAESSAELLEAVPVAADLWGALWHADSEGGRLTLPVTKGLRRGVVVGRLQLNPLAAGTRITLEVETSDFRLNRSAVVVLLLGGVGGLTTAVWPFFPGLLRLAPIGAVLALVAWLLVASRLRTSGIDDFVDLLSELARHPVNHRRAAPGQ